MSNLRHTWMVLAVAALLPLAGCTTDRNDEDEIPEAADTSGMPDYEVTLPKLDIHMDSATIPVPDVDVERPGKIEREND